MTEYTSDSDLSDDTRDLVKRGLATVRRKRLEVVEPRNAKKESHRRAGGDRENTNDEMRVAYDKLEREMNELRNIAGRRVNPSDTKVMSAWRERVDIARAEAFGDLEERAMRLAESAGRVQEKRYAGARVIEVAPIREVTANVNATDVQGGSTATATVAPKSSGETPERAETSRVRTNSVKIEPSSEKKKVKSEKKEKMETNETETKNRKLERKSKSAKKIREPSMSSESSEKQEEITPRRTSRDKEKRIRSKNKHRNSDTEEDIKKQRKS